MHKLINLKTLIIYAKMKTKKVFGALILLSIMLISFPAVFACPPGYSPGYWKSQCMKDVKGRTTEWDLEALIAKMPEPYNTWTVMQFYTAFKTGNNKYGYWTDLANLFNTAAGLAPY